MEKLKRLDLVSQDPPGKHRKRRVARSEVANPMVWPVRRAGEKKDMPTTVQLPPAVQKVSPHSTSRMQFLYAARTAPIDGPTQTCAPALSKLYKASSNPCGAS